MSNYDDEYYDDDAYDDDDEEIGSTGGINPFDRLTDSSSGSGLPGRDRAGGTRPGGSTPSGGGSSTFGRGQSPAPGSSGWGGTSRLSLGGEKKDDAKSTPPTSRGGGPPPGRYGASGTSRLDEDKDDDKSRFSSGSGAGRFGGASRTTDDKKDDDKSRFSGSSGAGHFGGASRTTDDKKDDDKSRFSSGSGASRFGGASRTTDDKKDDDKSRFGGTSQTSGGRAPYGGGAASSTQGRPPYGGTPRTPEDRSKTGTFPAVGGRATEDKKADDKKKEKGGGILGGFSLPFGGKKADDKSTTGTFRGAGSRPTDGKADDGKKKGKGLSGFLPFGGKKDDDKSDSSARYSAQKGGTRGTEGKEKSSGMLSGLTSRFSRKKQDDSAPKGQQPSSQSPFGRSAGSGAGQSSGSTFSSTPQRQSYGQARTGDVKEQPSAKGKGKATAYTPQEADTAKSGFFSRMTSTITTRLPFGGKSEQPKKTERQSKTRAASATGTSKVPHIKEDSGLSLDDKLDILGVGLTIGAVMLFLSSLSGTQGAITGTINTFFSQLLGWGAIAVPIVMAAIGLWLIVRRFGDDAPEIDPVRILGLVILYAGLLMIFMFAETFSPIYGVATQETFYMFVRESVQQGRGGGYVGAEIYAVLVTNFGEISAIVFVMGWMIVGVMLATRTTAGELAVFVVSVWRSFTSYIEHRAQKRRALAMERQAQLAEVQKQAVNVSKPAAEALPNGTSAALPPPSHSAEQLPIEQRPIPIRMGGRDMAMPQATVAAVAPSYPPVQTTAPTQTTLDTDSKSSRLGGFGDRFKKAMPALPTLPGRRSTAQTPIDTDKTGEPSTLGGMLRENAESAPIAPSTNAQAAPPARPTPPFAPAASPRVFPEDDAAPDTASAAFPSRRPVESSGMDKLPFSKPTGHVKDSPPAAKDSPLEFESLRPRPSRDATDADLPPEDAITPRAAATTQQEPQQPKPRLPFSGATARPQPAAGSLFGSRTGAGAAPTRPKDIFPTDEDDEDESLAVFGGAKTETPIVERTNRLDALRSGERAHPASSARFLLDDDDEDLDDEDLYDEDDEDSVDVITPPAKPAPSASAPPTSVSAAFARQQPAPPPQPPSSPMQFRKPITGTPQSAAPTAPAQSPQNPAVSQPAINRENPIDIPVPTRTSSKTRVQWRLPDYRTLLASGSDKDINREMLVQRARIIEETLSSFGAPGRVVEINTGPVITQFGVEPDYLTIRGGKKGRVKVGAIAALDKDLQLALGAKSIRIEAPVPGKGFVGIEVPNDEAALVSLRDVMESKAFTSIKSPLAIALGQSVDGAPIAADLTSMPHLLVAGTTGSGKSVCVNSIIASLLIRNSPEHVKFIMVDPKRVELTSYNGIPHLIAPVVVELERIIGVLKWVTREMDHRYKTFSNAGARNIDDYNAHKPEDVEIMPYIVVIVDELADLMMLAPDETERVITRIAALARATGIHLVISTQRPSVDVVTGLIKANFPARIAFAVASGIDSRVILDQPGAERLLGRGDMLYLSGDSPAPVRLQGVYVSDMEINNINRFWRTQNSTSSTQKFAPSLVFGDDDNDDEDDEGDTFAPATPTPRFTAPQSPAGTSTQATAGSLPSSQSAFWDDLVPDAADLHSAGFGMSEREDIDHEDELYEEAVEMVQRLKKASVSLLQRRLRIGYTRAARLIDRMEADGIVGPPTEGSKPREVLKNKA